jgi:6-pyruvoyltetrahydropterin/6-carboxytetrahydropterin synthase
MYRVAKEIVFRAGHYLRFGQDRREEPHKHDWRIRAMVETPELQADELVMDFEELGQLLRQVVEPLTQVQMLNELSAFENQNPSTERLARYVYEQLKILLPETIHLREVVVWECEDCRASYRPSE